MKAGVGFVDPEIWLAAAYYQTFRFVPISHGSYVCAGRVYINETQKFTMFNLVNAMESRVKTGDDLLIACHGNRHAISLRPGTGLWLDNAAIEMMLNPDSSQAAKFGMSKDDYISMITKLEKIQKLRIDHIALRACRIGNDRKFLQNFGRLFGARSVSAPTLRTMYSKPVYFGSETTGKKGEHMFRTMYMNYFDVPLRWMPQKKTVLGTTKTAHSAFKSGFYIEGRDVFRQFLTENMPDHTTPTKAQENMEEPTPIHGFCVPGDPSKFYFPKDPRYSNAMAWVYCGEPPSKTNPRNAMAMM